MAQGDTFHRAGLLVFDLRGAETPDDAAIERMVHRLAKFATRRAQAEDMPFPGLMCAVVEFAARIVASATTFNEKGEEANEQLVAAMVNNFRNRIRGAMETRAPGTDADTAKPQ